MYDMKKCQKDANEIASCVYKFITAIKSILYFNLIIAHTK